MEPAAPVAVRVEQASKTFAGGRRALSAVSFEVRSGERVALLGASGSGKSTLLRTLCGLEALDGGAGRIEVLGRTLQEGGRLAPDIRAQRRQVGIIFQQFNLVGRLPVLQNVLTGLAAEVPLWRAMLGRFAPAEQARALDALEAIGLGEQAFQRASTLSGGQQQRAAVARALVQGARVLLADEPVASLDPVLSHSILQYLEQLNREEKITVICSLHFLDLVHRYATRVVALKDGRVVFTGLPQEIDRARFKEIYGEEAVEVRAGMTA
jgi:phosphonate transport system ATP-binding protein